ncbi:MAG: tetratricopeptide repeat protein [Parachlamydiaceae bacterium]|nr:tetratricopeptide repeat protein [Parachlamydiaceae bacterium]
MSSSGAQSSFVSQYPTSQHGVYMAYGAGAPLTGAQKSTQQTTSAAHLSLGGVSATFVQFNQNTSTGIEQVLKVAHEGFDVSVQEQVNQLLERSQKLAEENFPSARSTLARLACELPSEHFHTEKERALDLLITLLETDKISKTSSNGLVKTAIDLMKSLDRDIAQTENIYVQTKMAYAYTGVIKNILRHYEAGHLNAISKDLKAQLLETQKCLSDLNQQKDPHLKHMAACNLEAISMLTTDNSKCLEAMKRLSSFAAAMSAAAQKDVAGLAKNLYAAFQGLGDEFTSSWFTHLFYLEKVGKKAETNIGTLEYFFEIIKPKKALVADVNLTLGIIEILFQIATHSPDSQIRTLALLGDSTKDLPGLVSLLEFNRFKEDAVFVARDSHKKNDSLIRTRTTELLFNFLTNSKDAKDVTLRTDVRNILIMGLKSKDTEKDVQDLLKARIPSNATEFALWAKEKTPPSSRALPPRPQASRAGYSASASGSEECKTLSGKVKVVTAAAGAGAFPAAGATRSRSTVVTSKGSAGAASAGAGAGACISTAAASSPKSSATRTQPKAMQLLSQCFEGVDINEVAPHFKGHKMRITASGSLDIYDTTDIDKLIDFLQTHPVTAVDFTALGNNFCYNNSQAFIKFVSSLKETKVISLTFDKKLSQDEADVIAKALVAALDAEVELVINVSLISMSLIAKALKKESPALAIKYCIQGIARNKGKDVSELYRILGLAYKSEGEHDKAIEAYKNAIELNDDNYFAFTNLAVIYKDLADDSYAQKNDKWKSFLEDAISYIRQAHRLNPKSAEVNHNLGAFLGSWWHKKRKNLEDKSILLEGIKYASTALEIDPTRQDTLKILGIMKKWI